MGLLIHIIGTLFAWSTSWLTHEHEPIYFGSDGLVFVNFNSTTRGIPGTTVDLGVDGHGAPGPGLRGHRRQLRHHRSRGVEVRRRDHPNPTRLLVCVIISGIGSTNSTCLLVRLVNSIDSTRLLVRPVIINIASIVSTRLLIRLVVLLLPCPALS
jgi:hypothetical protein